MEVFERDDDQSFFFKIRVWFWVFYTRRKRTIRLKFKRSLWNDPLLF